MSRVLVVGATGSIGRHVVPVALAAGDEVLVAALHSPAADRTTFEPVAERGPAQTDLEPLLAGLDADPPGSVDAVHDDPES